MYAVLGFESVVLGPWSFFLLSSLFSFAARRGFSHQCPVCYDLVEGTLFGRRIPLSNIRKLCLGFQSIAEKNQITVTRRFASLSVYLTKKNCE